MKVLVIDDSATTRIFTANFLRQLGHDVIEADDGAEGIQAYRIDKPDLIVLDVQMPGMDGYETAQAIREVEGDTDHWVPIIFISSNMEDDDIAKGIAAGGDDYLFKPVSKTVLKAKLEAMGRITEMQKRLRTLSAEVQQANLDLQRLSVTDGLTGLANRRRIDDRLVEDWARCSKTEENLALLMLDVDHFKKYNDSLGHGAGDECLKNIAGILEQVCNREADLVARYGGEEFLILMPDMDINGGLETAEQIRSSIEAAHLPHPESPTADVVTVSVGIAVTIPEPNLKPKSLLDMADNALYDAKEGGRNCVMLNANSLI